MDFNISGSAEHRSESFLMSSCSGRRSFNILASNSFAMVIAGLVFARHGWPPTGGVVDCDLRYGRTVGVRSISKSYYSAVHTGSKKDVARSQTHVVDIHTRIVNHATATIIEAGTSNYGSVVEAGGVVHSRNSAGVS